MTVDEIIDGCGGTVSVANALELTPSTVSSWRTANHIPRWWRPAIVGVAKTAGFELSEDCFPKRPERKVRVA